MNLSMLFSFVRMLCQIKLIPGYFTGIFDLDFFSSGLLLFMRLKDKVYGLIVSFERCNDFVSWFTLMLTIVMVW